MELRVRRERQAEQGFTCRVRLELAPALLVEPLELAQALVGLERRQAGHARPVGLEVGAELGHVDDEHAHVAHEGLLVLHLVSAEMLVDAVGHRLEPAPRVLEVVHLVGLLLRDVDVVLGEQAVLLEDGAELRESSIVSFSRMAAR